MSPKGVIYCGGPMRGLPLHNFPAFERASAYLRDLGWEVISPAEHDLEQGFDPAQSVEEQGFDTTEALRWDIEQIVTRCNAVYMLERWEDSRGATLEHTLARALGIQVLYQSPKDTDRYVYGWSSAIPKGAV